MSFTKNRVLFRADGDNKIGLGHVMRCASLSQMLNSEFDCFFVICRPSKEIVETLQNFGKIISLKETDMSSQINEFGKLLDKNDIVVFDGYLFDENYIDTIKNKVRRSIQIDDYAEGYFSSDLVINHASKNLIDKYIVSENTKVLCGSDYLILREEFLKEAAIKKREILKVDTVFVCMGGADPNNITLKVLESCKQVNFIKNIIVITGSAYMNYNQLEKFIFENANLNIVNYKNINAANMIELINMAEICICPSSSIALEVCCVKSGLLTGITIDNQRLIHEQLVKGNFAETIFDFNIVTVDEISFKLKQLNDLSHINKLMKNQSIFADGNSGKRILNEFKKFDHAKI